jgi:hypothetical protein
MCGRVPPFSSGKVISRSQVGLVRLKVFAMAFRLVAWNIRQGGGQRCPKIVAARRMFGADLVVLSEYRYGGR